MDQERIEKIPTLLTEGLRLPNAIRRSNREFPRNDKGVVALGGESCRIDPVSTNTNISRLPTEIMYRVFMFLKHSKRVSPHTLVPGPTKSPDLFDSQPQRQIPILLECAQVCRLWSSLCIPILFRKFYTSSVSPFIGLEPLQKLMRTESLEWARICLLSLVCVRLPEWGLGAPRMFYIDVEKTKFYFPQWNLNCPSAIIDRCAREFPNPSNSQWTKVFSCSMDLQDTFWELATGEPREPTSADQDVCGDKAEDGKSAANCFDDTDYEKICSGNGKLLPNQMHLPMMLRYSERMDLGCFLMFLPLKQDKFVLLRAKPIGKQLNSYDIGSGKLLIWDDQVYGKCTKCSNRLTRVQVCADCRVAQYCSRTCQKADWEQCHKVKCKSLAFEPYFPRDPEGGNAVPPPNQSDGVTHM